MRKKYHFVMHIACGLAIAGVGVFALMLLWNVLMPAIFGLPEIDCLQALGLLVLARIMFGGLGWRHFRPGMGRGMHHRGHLRNRWMEMSSDERKEFMKQHLHHAHWHDEQPDKQD